MTENLVYRINSYVKDTTVRNPYVYVKATVIEEAIRKFREHPIFKHSEILEVEYLNTLIE